MNVFTGRSTTLKIAAALQMDKLLIVMDKAFGKIKNINAMLADKQDIRFIVAVPFSLAFPTEAVNKERSTIDTIEIPLLLVTTVFVALPGSFDGARNIPCLCTSFTML